MLEMTTLDGTSARPSAAQIAALRAALTGDVLVGGDEGYDIARKVWNGNVDRRPGLIVRCTNAADVQRAVNFARDHALLTSVRGGGHSAPGYGVNDGGLVIDLTRMRGISVDPVARTARADGGVLWLEFDKATQVHGLATTGGTVSNTGIGGLTAFHGPTTSQRSRC